MSRVENAIKLSELEQKREALENMIKDAGSYYFERFVVTTQLTTKDFNRSTRDVVEFVPDKGNYVKFLEAELEIVKHQTAQIYNMLRLE